MTIIKHSPRGYGNFIDELLNTIPENWNKDFQTGWSTVPVNIYESTEGYHIDVNAPVRLKEDFQINIEKDQLTIGFEKKEATEKSETKTIRNEFKLSSFKRVFTLDEKVNADAVEAKYENGILKVYLPKKEVVKATPKQIAIS